MSGHHSVRPPGFFVARRAVVAPNYEGLDTFLPVFLMSILRLHQKPCANSSYDNDYSYSNQSDSVSSSLLILMSC